MSKKTYELDVSWTSVGKMRIEASSLEEAETIAIEEEPLPTDSDYLEGSFSLDKECPDYGDIIEYHQQ